jgi:hypothetical protein
VTGVLAGTGDEHPAWVDRLAAGCLAIVIVAGSALLWIGVPVAAFWAAAQLTRDGVTAVLVTLLATPPAMVGFAWLLYMAGARYEALRGRGGRTPSPPAWRASLGEERADARRRAGGRPLVDVAMTVSAAAAVVVLVVWFFLFAELRLSPFP